MKKLTCHCGGVEIQVKIPEEGFKKLMRCNCSLCKRKGYIIGVIGPEDLKIIKGEKIIKYDQLIGIASKDISVGDHVHVENKNPQNWGADRQLMQPLVLDARPPPPRGACANPITISMMKPKL